MASEIRVDKINSLSGVGTVTLSPTGVDISGITTVATLKATTGIVTTLTATTGIVTTLTSNTTTLNSTTTATGNINVSGANITLQDSGGSSDDRLVFGAGSDLSIYHDGSNSFLQDSGTGDLLISGDSVSIVNAAASEFKAKFISDGAVELYHDNSKKLETASGGVTVTGAVTATSFSGDGSSLTGISGGLTVSDQWRLSALQSITTSDVVLTNWERPDTSGTGGGAYLGSGMSQSSGVFSFPTTGIYLITFIASINVANNAAVRYAEIDIVVTKDNSSYVEAAAGFCCINRPTGEAASGNVTCNFIMDVENVSNDKVRFESTKDNVGNHDILGSSTINYTTVTFLRLGDT